MKDKIWTDHLGREVQIPEAPQRIISLCPSQTETLYDLGLGSRIAGRTYFCIHPAESVEEAVKVGGTKQLKMERIKEIAPDLVIAEKEENTKEMVAELERDYPVYVTDVKDVGSAVQMIRDLGKITGQAPVGEKLAGRVQESLEGIVAQSPRERCLYFIWRKPWMAAGRGTFIHDMMQRGGWDNVLNQDRYPELSAADLQALDPQRIFLSSEPYPFAERHIEELKEYFPAARFSLVDGEMFSWYGSRLLHTAAYLKELQC